MPRIFLVSQVTYMLLIALPPIISITIPPSTKRYHHHYRHRYLPSPTWLAYLHFFFSIHILSKYINLRNDIEWQRIGKELILDGFSLHEACNTRLELIHTYVQFKTRDDTPHTSRHSLRLRGSGPPIIADPHLFLLPSAPAPEAAW